MERLEITLLVVLPLFAIACLRRVHVLLRPRVDKGAKVLDGVRLHSSGSTWCGCSRGVFVLPPPSRPVFGDGFPRLD